MNAGELLEVIKANPADFVGSLGSSIRRFLIEEIGIPEKWWVSYREPSKYGSDRWKESGRFDPDDLETWTKQERENAKRFLNLNKLLTAAAKIEDLISFIDLNGNLVDPPRQLSTFEKLSLSPHSGRCMGFFGEFIAAFNFLCQRFIPYKSCAYFPGFQDKFDICIAGSKWLEAIGNIPEYHAGKSNRLTRPPEIAARDTQYRAWKAVLCKRSPKGFYKTIDSWFYTKRQQRQRVLSVGTGKAGSDPTAAQLPPRCYRHSEPLKN